MKSESRKGKKKEYRISEFLVELSKRWIKISRRTLERWLKTDPNAGNDPIIVVKTNRQGGVSKRLRFDFGSDLKHLPQNWLNRSPFMQIARKHADYKTTWREVIYFVFSFTPYAAPIGGGKRGERRQYLVQELRNLPGKETLEKSHREYWIKNLIWDISDEVATFDTCDNFAGNQRDVEILKAIFGRIPRERIGELASVETQESFGKDLLNRNLTDAKEIIEEVQAMHADCDLDKLQLMIARINKKSDNYLAVFLRLISDFASLSKKRREFILHYLHANQVCDGKPRYEELKSVGWIRSIHYYYKLRQHPIIRNILKQIDRHSKSLPDIKTDQDHNTPSPHIKRIEDGQ